MKSNFFLITLLLFGLNTYAQQTSSDELSKSNIEIESKSEKWVNILNLNNPEKEKKVISVISSHLKAVRDWHNDHPYTLIPEGLNPQTGNKLSKVERQIIIDSTIPESVHINLMTGLRKDLTEEQVETILDQYTVGKVAFTLKGYKAIVPDLTAEEEAVILKHLKQAREMAVDYKNMELISGIFEIYKTKCELYLYQNGRNWKALFKSYVDAVKAQKAKAQ